MEFEENVEMYYLENKLFSDKANFVNSENYFIVQGIVIGEGPLGNVAAGMVSLKGYQGVASNSAANLKAAAARIQDTDFALETANLTKASVLNQSAMAMVAQANQAQAAILTVIQ